MGRQKQLSANDSFKTCYEKSLYKVIQRAWVYLFCPNKTYTFLLSFVFGTTENRPGR